ncbi:glycosyltransferase [Levilactobacillus bambusae]|uniref:UDP-D-galactose--(Glucosyl)LPS-1, 6-D-galactosyltransferase n=1 Tax=Levilactobacillus bambusae TaxID=2024736 RepID=A0A2V1MXR0_9LACO|nr:glycosyltransferase [Levilactobacillus bambusae]PWF99788.1 UDP-D-galactose--(glucosyl)LPS-1,6-D-galactosyltransferase [Levilactobacillus bambusae]
MKKQRIILFTPFMSGYGGTETVIKNLFISYNKLDNLKSSMKLVNIGGTIDTTWTESIQDKKIVFMARPKLVRTIEYLFSLPFLLWYFVKTEKPDVVISTNPVMWTILFFIKKIMNEDYRVCAWYHYSLASKPLKKIELHSFDQFLAISSGIEKQLIDLGIKDTKINVIFNPIFPTENIVYRSKNENKLELIYVGRQMLDGQKNMRILFDALSSVQFEWHLNVYGEGKNKEVEDYVRHLGLFNNVTFNGFQQDLWENLTDVDALILTSNYEGLPMVLIEAIANGIPVISSNCDTGPSDIVNSENGLLFQVDKKKDLIKQMNTFFLKKDEFNSHLIKKSINKFYAKQYVKRFIKVVTEEFENN